VNLLSGITAKIQDADEVLPPVKKYAEMTGQEMPSQPICKHYSPCSLRNLVDRLKKDLNA
jgi:hypothetical protein